MNAKQYLQAIRAIERHFGRTYRPGVVEEVAPDFADISLDAMRLTYRRIRREWNNLPPIQRVLDIAQAEHRNLVLQAIRERENQRSTERLQEERDAHRFWNENHHPETARKHLRTIKALLAGLKSPTH